MYIDQTDLENRFGAQALVELTNDVRGATVDTEVLEQVITDAQAEVDGYLAVAYDLPLESTPRLVKRLACDICWYMLHQRRPRTPEEVRKAYEDAGKLLEKISTRKVSLGLSPAPAQNPGQAAVLTVADRVFDRDSMKGF